MQYHRSPRFLHGAIMLMVGLAVASTITGMAAAVPSTAHGADPAEKVADEAVAAALALPQGYKRDVALRSVSRNLRWFGQPAAGLRAARAMSDGGVHEIPPGAVPAPPRYVPLKEAMPTGSPCDAGLWRQDGGGEATTAHAREAWARTCLLTRHFDWIGRPSVEQVRAAATGLPAGEIKGAILAMLVRAYGDPDTLRFVKAQVDQQGARMPSDVRAGLVRMLAEPAILYRLGRKAEALTAARTVAAYEPRAEMIRALVAAGEGDAAAEIFEMLSDTPPEFGENCSGWFNPVGGLGLILLGNASSPAPGIGPFLDKVTASALFRRVCPNGLEASDAVDHLLAAGRYDAAIARARQEATRPFLLVGTLLEVGHIQYRGGNREEARAHAEEAAALLPPFDPGDPINPNQANVSAESLRASATPNFGERDGDMQRRFEVIQLLAAAGAVAEADALARKQPAGAFRAVALSAAIAGRAGLRFDDQAPTLSGIAKSDL